jgi:hypothetical protein
MGLLAAPDAPHTAKSRQHGTLLSRIKSGCQNPRPAPKRCHSSYKFSRGIGDRRYRNLIKMRTKGNFAVKIGVRYDSAVTPSPRYENSTGSAVPTECSLNVQMRSAIRPALRRQSHIYQTAVWSGWIKVRRKIESRTARMIEEMCHSRDFNAFMKSPPNAYEIAISRALLLSGIFMALCPRR